MDCRRRRREDFFSDVGSRAFAILEMYFLHKRSPQLDVIVLCAEDKILIFFWNTAVKIKRFLFFSTLREDEVCLAEALSPLLHQDSTRENKKGRTIKLYAELFEIITAITSTFFPTCCSCCRLKGGEGVGLRYQPA